MVLFRNITEIVVFRKGVAEKHVLACVAFSFCNVSMKSIRSMLHFRKFMRRAGLSRDYLGRRTFSVTFRA